MTTPAAGQDLTGTMPGTARQTKSTPLKERAVKPDLIEQVGRAAETIILRRLHLKRIDGFTLEMSREIAAAAIEAMADPSEASKEIERLREALATVRGHANDFHPDRDAEAPLALAEMRDAIHQTCEAALQPILPSGGGGEEGSSVAGVPCPQMDTPTPLSDGGSR